MAKSIRKDALKRLAQQAKERLSSGGYKQPQKYGSKFKIYEGGIVADYKLVVLSDTEDVKLYKRVCELLRENEDVINPIGQICDSSKLEQMSSFDRDRYVINMRDKYLEMKDRFYRENLKSAN